MTQNFLYEEYNILSKRISKDIPGFVVENLNPSFELREYQKEAFSRFFDYLENYEEKELPVHLLFNMATGSGKTLIMAGIILYLYEKGYRNFLFFVNSNNIIEKTKDNFLNNISSKYLFNQKIFFGNKEVKINKVDNFEGTSGDDINICFTTIQKMHGDLINEKENSLTFEDFKDKKIVLLSDEAHHGQVKTRNGELLEKPNWENTVEKIFKENNSNLLLEFTATMDFLDKNILEKYLNKVIYKYDLKEFRNDGFSKDVELLHSDFGKKERIIQAIILNQYRQEVAGKNGINLKPVILFKAQKTIEQSMENKELFHKIIDDLSVRDIGSIRKKTNVEVLQKAFEFFHENKITDAILIKKLKSNFSENKTLSVNEEKDKEKYQLLINSLEDKDNQIRAIFAVQKLNEGWDVLNLFDIVRLYETRDAKNSQPGKTTISEAQLIGRGARYFPFVVDKEQEKYKRKYDKNLDSELRVLEELYYHCHPGRESRYIAEIRTALIKEGMIDEKEQEVELRVKDEIKKNKFYQAGLVWANKKIETNFNHVKSISDLGVDQKIFYYTIHSGIGGVTTILDENIPRDRNSVVSNVQNGVKIKSIEKHIVRNALAKNDFYYFSNLKNYFPKLKSMSQFVEKKEYLADLQIIFKGKKEDLYNMSNENKFQATVSLLADLETLIKTGVTEYKGSEIFTPKQISKIFIDKKIKIKLNDERLDGQETYLEDKNWYIFNANYGTGEEKNLVKFIARKAKDLKEKFKEFYLIRNERQLKIYNFKDGRAFEPDFLLFLVNKKGKNITYQLFVEPKGAFLAEHDKWKEDFLKDLKEKFKNKILEFGKTKKYKIIGLPFYSKAEESEFEEDLQEYLS